MKGSLQYARRRLHSQHIIAAGGVGGGEEPEEDDGFELLQFTMNSLP